MIQRQLKDDGSVATACVCAAGSVLAIAMGAIYYAARVGFNNPCAPILKVVALSVFLVTAPESWRVVRSRLKPEHAWISAPGPAATLALLVAVLSGALARGVVPVLAIFGTIGLAGFALVLRRSARALRFRTVFLLGGALGFALWCSALAWGYGYAQPLFIESIAAGTPSTRVEDPLFHAAIANMLSVHGTPSTGLDGISQFRYHVGSHWVFAQLSNLLGCRLIEFYQLGFPVLMFPLLFASLLWFCLLLSSWPVHAPPSALFWMIFVAGAVGILPLDVQDRLAVGWWRPISESYTLSLVLAFALLAAIVRFCQRDGWKSPRPNFGNVVFLFFVLPASICACGTVKVSTMVLLVAAASYTFVRLKLYRSLVWGICIFEIVCLGLLSLRLTSSPDHVPIEPFHFIRTYVGARWVTLWPFGYFIWMWLFAAARLRKLRDASVRELVLRFRDHELFDLELVAVVVVIGCLPGMLLAIPGASAGYFSDPHRWLALALLLATLSPPVTKQSEPPHRAAWDIPLRQVANLLLGVALAGVIATNTANVMYGLVKTNLDTRRALLGAGAGVGSLFRQDGSLERALARLPAYQLLSTLRRLDDQPRSEKAASALFVPHSNTLFWKLLPECVAPFLGPALAGIAMLDGLPSASCEYFGYQSYRLRIGGWGTRTAEHYDCPQALRRGFTQVLELDMSPDGRPYINDARCGAVKTR